MDYEEAKRIIDGYNENERMKKEEQKREYQQKLISTITEIKELKNEIQEIIRIGNLCLTEGIETNPSNKNHYRKCTYEDGAYETDAIDHQLGFYPNSYRIKNGKCTHYNYIGYRMGGACGNWDFITDGEVVLAVPHEDCYKIEFGDKFKTPDLMMCRRFLKEFNNFQEVFYDYIESLKED